MSSDLPEGQQSKFPSEGVHAETWEIVENGRSSKRQVLVFTEEALAAHDARVRADVAEDLWREAQRLRAEDWPAKVGIEFVEGFEAAVAWIERQTPRPPAESVVGAPTPSAGTRQQPEAIPVRAVPQTWSAHLGNAWFAIARPQVRPGDHIAVSFDGNDNVWYGRVAGVRPGVGGEVWIDATPVGALPEDEGTRQP